MSVIKATGEVKTQEVKPAVKAEKSVIELKKTKTILHLDNVGKRLFEKAVSEPFVLQPNIAGLYKLDVPAESIVSYSIVVSDCEGGLVSHLSGDNTLVIENLIELPRECVIKYVIFF